MDDLILQVGVGGALAIIIIREVLGFLTRQKTEVKANGIGPVSRAEFEEHKKTVQYRDNCSQIVKRIDGRFDDMKEMHQGRFDGLDRHMKDVKELVKAMK